MIINSIITASIDKFLDEFANNSDGFYIGNFISERDFSYIFEMISPFSKYKFIMSFPRELIPTDIRKLIKHNVEFELAISFHEYNVEVMLYAEPYNFFFISEKEDWKSVWMIEN